MLTMTNLDAVQAHPIAIPSDFAVRCAEYADWYSENGHIVRHFNTIALKAIEEGRGHFASRFILEYARWYTKVAEKQSAYKLNNNLCGLLSRHFALTYPEHEGYFRERRMKGEPESRAASQAILRNALRPQQGFLF